MDDSTRITLAPRTLVALWLAAVMPMASGVATGGLAAALGGAFAIGCPLVVAVSARWPARAPRIIPLYFAALFVIAVTSLEFNSLAFVVDTWSALLLGLLTMDVRRRRDSRRLSAALSV
jgi:hypothetical protein